VGRRSIRDHQNLTELGAQAATKNDPLPPRTDSDTGGVQDVLRRNIDRRDTGDATVVGEQAPGDRAQHPSGVNYIPKLSIVSSHLTTPLAYLDMKSQGPESGTMMRVPNVGRL